MTGMRALARRMATMLRDRRGNVMMIMGFALVPLTFATGMVIDYSRAARLQTRLNAAADAAALSGTTLPMLDESMLAACARARRTFSDAAAQNSPGLTLDAATSPTVRITETYPALPSVTFTCPGIDLPLPAVFNLPRSRSITVSYSGTSANAFGGILGAATIAIGGTGTASSQTTDYIDIHMALDTSQSMGLAATDADAIKLWNATKAKNGRGCTFGCHSKSPSEPYSMEEVARMPDVNARMRIDVLRDATSDMISTAMNSEGASKYRFALYRIGKNAGRWGIGVDEYAPLSTDLAAIKTKVTGLTLSANDGSVGFGDTDLPATTTFVLPKMGATSTAVDTGSTQATARKFLFLVTDGVTDVERNNCTWGHCTAPISAATCDAYKNAGVTVGVVYTTYLPVKADPTNPSSTALRDEYRVLVEPFAGQIKPNLEACASPGWFFEAADGPGIHAAMQRLFDQASKTPRLTQ